MEMLENQENKFFAKHLNVEIFVYEQGRVVSLSKLGLKREINLRRERENWSGLHLSQDNQSEFVHVTSMNFALDVLAIIHVVICKKYSPEEEILPNYDSQV